MEVRRQSSYSDETIKKMILRVGGATNTTVLFPDSTATDKYITSKNRKPNIFKRWIKVCNS